MRGEQSETLLDLRMACLDRQGGELEALVTVFGAADETVVRRSVDAANALDAPENCASVLATDADREHPVGDDIADEVAAIDTELDLARALGAAGRYEEMRRVAQGAVTRARGVDHPPTLLRALTRQGHAQKNDGSLDDAQASLEEALHIAAEVGDHRTQTRLWSTLIHLVGRRMRKHEAGLAWELPARVALERRR